MNYTPHAHARWPLASSRSTRRITPRMLDTRGAGAAAAGRHVTLIAGRQEHGSESGQRPRPRVSATASTIPPGSRSEALDRPRQGLDRLDRQSLDLLRHRASTQRFNRNSASRRHTSHRTGAEPAARPVAVRRDRAVGCFDRKLPRLCPGIRAPRRRVPCAVRQPLPLPLCRTPAPTRRSDAILTPFPTTDAAGDATCTRPSTP